MNFSQILTQYLRRYCSLRFSCARFCTQCACWVGTPNFKYPTSTLTPCASASYSCVRAFQSLLRTRVELARILVEMANLAFHLLLAKVVSRPKSGLHTTNTRNAFSTRGKLHFKKSSQFHGRNPKNKYPEFAAGMGKHAIVCEVTVTAGSSVVVQL